MNKKWIVTGLLSLIPLALWAGSEADSGEPGVPHILILPPQRVLAITAQGDPNAVAGGAYKKLFRTYFANVDKADKHRRIAPMARWPLAQLDSAKTGWQGVYALPLYGKFPTPPPGNLRIETWEYGMVAEILHIGSYAGEAADIATLKEFIARNGLAIRGSHEEVYVKGPGMIFAGNPRKYRTLIRYQVERIGDMQAPISKIGGEGR